MTDWNPDSYDRFAGVRLQPALDMLSRVPSLPEGHIIDLGCGSGGVAPALQHRWPDRRLIGIDTSHAMLAKAKRTGAYSELVDADIGTWTTSSLPALIFSNAALQWIGDHRALLLRLVEQVASGGMLAVQMPYQHAAPSHLGWSVARDRVFGASDTGPRLNVLSPEAYFDVLSPLGQVNIWMTDYVQHLMPSADGHPLRLFTQSTFGKPFLDQATAGEKAQLIDAYEEVMAKEYPLRADGSVLFPFRRLFFTLRLA